MVLNSHLSLVSKAGTRGSGKTMTLMQIVDYCAAKDWVVLYVPKSEWILVSNLAPFVAVIIQFLSKSNGN